MGIFTRSIRPPDDIVPNENDPALVPPSTVGPDQLVTPGDKSGLVLEGELGPDIPPPRVLASGWSGWPADWWPPLWGGQGPAATLADTAWMCLDLNASVLSTMPPYLVTRDGLEPPSADWINNPDPDGYASWEEFAKTLWWDYQLGEAFVLATARYATGYPARFHVVPPWAVNVEIAGGRRYYRIGEEDVTGDILHIRYRSSADRARGEGPLDVGQARLVAAQVLARYGTRLASGGGIPAGTLVWPHYELSEGQAAEAKAQWMSARASAIGEPAVLSGGWTWNQTQINPRDMGLVDLLTFHESRIANLLGVPPFLVGLPSGGDSMTYSNVSSIFDYHWRAGLRPKAQAVMAALSQWALPRGTTIEVNRDEYVQPGPLERAQTAQIYAGIVDAATGRAVLSVDEIRAAERFTNSDPDLPRGVLR